MDKTFISIILLSVLLIGCNDNDKGADILTRLEDIEAKIDYLTEQGIELSTRVKDIQANFDYLTDQLGSLAKKEKAIAYKKQLIEAREARKELSRWYALKNDFKKLETLYAEYRQSVKNTFIDPQNYSLGRFVTPIRHFLGSLNINPQLYEEHNQREFLSAVIKSVSIQYVTLYCRGYTSGMFKYFKEHHMIPSLENTPDSFERAMHSMLQNINEYIVKYRQIL